MTLPRAFLALACLWLTTVTATAQTVSATTGTITGKVVDHTQAVLPGVSVTIASSAMMGTRTDVTNTEGIYRFVGVPPGEYRVTFELTGFTTVAREGIRVTLGFTATVNVELGLATLQESVTVRGESPVVDTQATQVSTSFDAQTLANLPSARDYWSVLAESPSLKLTRIDVGGSASGTQTGYSVYGTSGQNRPMVEGINSTEHTGAFGNYIDYGSMEEIAVNTAAHGADMAVPGVQAQFISKSGGNAYHGTFYGDYERADWQAFNIDDDQIRRGVQGGGGLAARDVNRLHSYYDVNAGAGGYVRRDRLWWYASVRVLDTSARYTNFPVEPHRTKLTNLTAKMTYNLNENNKLIAYVAPSRKNQPTRLDRFRINSRTAIHEARESSFNQDLSPRLWKGEWNSVVSESMFFEIRAGQYGYDWSDEALTGAPSFEDIGNNKVYGGARTQYINIRRNQVLGSLSHFRNFYGEHNLKFGWEIFRETRTAGSRDGTYGGGVVHVLRNGAPIEVSLLTTPTASENGMWNYSGYLNDSWRPNRRLTVNAGVRFDRYRNFLPEQVLPAGPFNPTAINFAAVDNLNDWNLVAPRVGASIDLTGNGRTVLKVNYGQYWWNPGYTLSETVNPNPQNWERRYVWTDPSRNGVWDPGEEGRLISTRGGSATEALDPSLGDTFTREAILWLERELLPNFGVRTGFIWRGQRQKFQRLNVNQPFEAFSVPTTIPDPGPDGVFNNSDDGPPVAGFNLAPEYLNLSPQNVTQNTPRGDDDFYTWEITGTKRMTNRWSLMASFSHTWNQAQENTFFDTGFRQNSVPITPNDLINTGKDGRIEYTDWSVKVHGTIEAPWGIKLTPLLRHQAGQQFGRTFVATLNYGNVRIPAEKISTRRQDNITVFDTRVEKVFTLTSGLKLSGFADLYNIFNSNAEQNISWSSGTSWLRPLNIIPPRILRLGTKLEW